MQWNMDTLSIVEYDSEMYLHRKFKRELIADSLIFMYFKNTIEQYLFSTENLGELELETAYLLANTSNLIGYLYLGNCDFKGTLAIDYAIHEDYRGNHLGVILLKELKEYLIQNMKKVQAIDLAIQKNNIRSIKTALGAGFVYHRRIDDTVHYRYK